MEKMLDARKIVSSSIFVLCMVFRSESNGYVDRRSVYVEEGLRRLEKQGVGEQSLTTETERKEIDCTWREINVHTVKPKGTGPMNALRRNRGKGAVPQR